MYAIVAQLDRAFGSDPEGQRFESSRSHKIPSTLSCAGDFYLRPGGFEQHGPAGGGVSNQPSGLLLSAGFLDQ